MVFHVEDRRLDESVVIGSGARHFNVHSVGPGFPIRVV